jgi:hypothetical protein
LRPDSAIERRPTNASTEQASRHSQALAGQGAAHVGEGETFGGVEYYGSTKEELYERAKKLDVAGRSRMTKKELARAIARKQ